jgi:hypothetical protein
VHVDDDVVDANVVNAVVVVVAGAVRADNEQPLRRTRSGHQTHEPLHCDG